MWVLGSVLSSWVGIDLYTSIVKGFFSVIQYVTFVIGYFISLLATVTITIEAFYLTFVLNLNYGVVDSPAVQIGFSVILAFANILFVAAIIVMAVATIVRYNAYGVKQLLFKIVIAAVAVNFSLVIASTVLAFSDQLSIFFLSKSVPVTSIKQGQAGTLENMNNFASQLAGTFNPQRAFLWGEKGGATTSTANQPDFEKRFDGAKSAGAIMSAIFGVFITVFILLQIVIFLGVLIIAFFVRYIWLGLLLMMMPGVWVAWIFPFSQSYVRQWTSKFIKWTFFGPVTLFFLYLGMRISAALNSSHSVNAEQIINGSNKELVTGLNNQLSAAFIPVMTNFLNAAMVGGALWGGLYLAHKMGIGAATTGMKAMEVMGNSVKRRAQQPFRAVGKAAAARGKDFAGRNFDRLRTLGKDEFGNSKLTQVGSKWATAGSGNRLKSFLAQASGVQALGKSMTKLGKADDKDAKARSENSRYDWIDAATGPEVLKLAERKLSGSLASNPDEMRRITDKLIKSKQLGTFFDENPNDDLKRKMMTYAKQNGQDKDILKAHAMAAVFSPPSKKTVIQEEDGKMKAVKRNMTQAEQFGAAFKAVKDEDFKDMIANNPFLFGGNKDNPDADPTEMQIEAAKALGRRISKIDDSVAQERAIETLRYVKRNEAQLRKPLEVREGSDFSRSSGKVGDAIGMGYTESDIKQFDAIIREVEKNVFTAGTKVIPDPQPSVDAEPTAQGETKSKRAKLVHEKLQDQRREDQERKAREAAEAAERKARGRAGFNSSSTPKPGSPV